jgi:prolipoprotein diacylglyceryltransferase
VRFFLLHLDDQARNKAYGLWITLGLLLGAVGGIALAVIANSVLQDEVFGAGKVMVLGGIAGASLGTAIAKWRFKPRFRAYTKPLEEVRPKA